MIFCCKEHVELALDIMVDEHELAPILEEVKREVELSTPCEYCSNPAAYIVANKNSDT
ncbi:CxxH/CxxC protein [Lederbergia lenta]|uniref:CxxH/CxxC protein n=1 Tax=Lederbergia lenta TaxID=1467 RepID=UPI0020424E60|nr:CxxH/CxxC protein [Lederbergia lenta]MCM3112807.1 CxxH/CxxC protein [Lederbergia lenta]